MRSFITISATICVLTCSSSCRTADNFDQRKYTDGKYHDLNLFKDKSEKTETVPVEAIVELDSCKSKLTSAVEQLKDQIATLKPGEVIPSAESLHKNYPMLANRLDSTIAIQVKRDTSSWMNDTLPDAIETALSTQAMLGLGTVGGLITIVEPESIWFFAIPMIAAPVSLFISLIAAAVAMSKINRGEIDGKYRAAMGLWAVCLLINLVLGSIVLIHYMFL